MEEKINSILNDLFELDPKFRSHEKQLRNIVLNLLESKPETKFDKKFAENLRKRILHQEKSTMGEELSVIKHNFMKRISWVFSVAAVCAMVIMSTLYINNKNGNELSFFTGVKITSAGEGAFGELANVTAMQAGGSGGGNGNQVALDSVGSSPVANAPAPGLGSSKETMSSDMGRMIAPYEPTNYKYIYNGEALVLSDEKRDVIKRVKGFDLGSDVSALLNSLSQGMINFGTFGNMKLQSAYFVEEGGDKYGVQIDANNGSMYISGAYPEPGLMDKMSCPPNANCVPTYNPIKIEEVPADDILIDIAQDFVNGHGIPTEAYAPPRVHSEWRAYYEKALLQNQGQAYVPESVSVVYPQLINGQEVYDESGNLTGMMVGIHVRNKKVTHVGEITTQIYQSSSYDAETDVKKIMDIMSRGGIYGYEYPGAAKTVEVELGEPKLEYVKMWNYTNNQSEELLVPSLIFPVVKAPENDPNFYRKSVVVPLIKQILDRNPYMPVDILRTEPAAQPSAQ